MNTTYSWLERWGAGKKPAPKYWEGINNLLESLAPLGVDDTERIKELHHAWFTKVQEENPLGVGSLMNLHSHLTKAIKIYFDGQITLANSYRDPTGKHEIEHIALAHCKPPQDISDRHNKRSQLNLLDRVSNRGWIDKPYEIIERAESLLASGIEKGIYSEMAAALCVVTGRRVREILATAKFAPKSKYSVMFVEGKLKTRGKESSPQEIPTLIEASKVLEAMALLREKFIVDDTNFNLIEYHKDQVRRCVIRTFADLVPTIQMVKGEMRPTTHRMRAVYNCLATFFFAPPTLKDELYTKAIMAHDDGGATLNYTIYQMSDEVIAAHQGKRQGVWLNRPGVEVLEMFRKPSAGDDEMNNETQSNNESNESGATKDEIGSGDNLATDVTKDEIGSGDNLVTKAKALLKSTKPIDVIVGLMALTGRSASEILKSGVFKSSGDNHFVKFSLQATSPQAIAVLASASLVLKTIERVRTHPWVQKERWRYLTPNNIDYKIAESLESSIKNHFTGIIDNLNCDGLIAAYDERTRSIELPLIDERLGKSDPDKPKVATIHCEDKDKARFDALAIKLGTQNERDTFAALLSMAETALADDKVTKEAEASTQTKDFSEALATLEAKLRSEFESRLQQLELLVESKVADNSAVTTAPQKTKSAKVSQVAESSVDSKVSNENNDSDVANKPRRSAETKISHAITGVMNYNDTVAPEKAEKWHISESLIARLTGCNRPAIRKFFESYSTMISDHNHKHELASRHNTGRSEEEKALKEYVETFDDN